jgi:hypothetical protein
MNMCARGQAHMRAIRQKPAEYNVMQSSQTEAVIAALSALLAAGRAGRNASVKV